MAEHPTLWQFKYSHFNEKARWALDFKHVRHRRRSVLPGPHAPRILWMTGQKSVPVLMLNGTAIADSTRIIAALEAAYPESLLYPADAAARQRALELEEFFDEELGPYIRRAWFHEILSDADYSATQLTVGFSPTAQRVYRAMFPVIAAIMKKDMRIDAASAEAARAKVNAALDRLEAELQPSGYLVGDQFSVADLTAAALLAPVLMPAEFSYPLRTPLPAPAAKYQASLAGRRGFQWATEMFRRHRGTSMEVAAA